MKLKKPLSLLLAGAMALTVAACTPSEAQPSGSPSGSQPAQGETVTITKTA